MCYITATEFKKNLGHYIKLCEKEDVFVTKNKKVVAKLSHPSKDAVNNFFQLRDSFMEEINEDVDYDEILRKAIMEKCGY